MVAIAGRLDAANPPISNPTRPIPNRGRHREPASVLAIRAACVRSVPDWAVKASREGSYCLLGGVPCATEHTFRQLGSNP
jgi:hypothetical protein